MDCLFREKTHTQKKLRLFFGRHLHTSTYGATCRGLSISPITRLTRAKKMYPLQGLRSESKCVMADSLWICVDYLYLVHNGVIVDPLIEPAAFRLSRTRPSPLATVWWWKGRHRNLLHATHPSYLRFAAISRVISCSSFPSLPVPLPYAIGRWSPLGRVRSKGFRLSALGSICHPVYRVAYQKCRSGDLQNTR
jgi:hypothetical protein